MPHSRQRDGSTKGTPSVILIAPVGHAWEQAPHPVHLYWSMMTIAHPCSSLLMNYSSLSIGMSTPTCCFLHLMLFY